jgi:hypothetical protein
MPYWLKSKGIKMSEFKKEEYIEISLTKIIVSIFQNIRIFGVIFILGAVLVIGFAFIWSPSYTYKQIIQPPLYLNGLSEATLLDDNKLNIILQNNLADMQQSDPNNILLNSIKVLAPAKDGDSSKDIKRMYLWLSVSSTFENKDQVQILYNTLMSNFSNSTRIKKQVELWQQNMQIDLKANEENIVRYNGLIKQNQDYLKELSSQKRLSGIDGQTLLSSYISRIDSYQKKIFSLEDSQKDLKLKLESLQPDLSTFGSITYEKSSKFSIIKILALGFVLTLFMAFMVVFIKVVIRGALVEYEASKKLLS